MNYTELEFMQTQITQCATSLVGQLSLNIKQMQKIQRRIQIGYNRGLTLLRDITVLNTLQAQRLWEIDHSHEIQTDLINKAINDVQDDANETTKIENWGRVIAENLRWIDDHPIWTMVEGYDESTYVRNHDKKVIVFNNNERWIDFDWDRSVGFDGQIEGQFKFNYGPQFHKNEKERLRLIREHMKFERDAVRLSIEAGRVMNHIFGLVHLLRIVHILWIVVLVCEGVRVHFKGRCAPDFQKYR